MSKGTILATALAALMLAGPPAQAREPRALEPSTDWVLDYADERCTLVRSFGEGRDALQLQVTSYGSPHSVRILLFGESVPKNSGPSGDMQYRLTPDTEDRNVIGLHGQTGELNVVSFSATFGPDLGFEAGAYIGPDKAHERRNASLAAHPGFENEVNDMLIGFSDRSRIGLRLGNMEAPISALRTCIDDLYAHWGLDPEQQKTLSRPAVPDRSAIAQMQRDYPSRMRNRGTSAFVPVRVMVDAQGEVTSCHVQNGNVDEQFKQAACSGLAGPYQPALDAEGRPMDSVFNAGVVYLM